MKIAKKLSKSIIALAMCLLLATAALAAATVTYTATLEDDVLCVNELTEETTVTLTVKADQKVEMDAFTAQVNVPKGLVLADITNTNEALEFGVDNFWLENGMIMWYSDDAENVTNDLLAEISIKVPEGTAAGVYEIVFNLIDISRDWGMPWENGKTITATLNIVDHADDDKDHKCDICDEDGITECSGGTATCLKPAVCEVCGEEYGETDSTNHVGEETTAYTNNGDDHTVTVTCECGEVISTETGAHDFTDGKCVCGAEEPEAPTDPEEPTDPEIPDVTTGLKGDVNLDGEVDMNDVVALMQHVLKAEMITDATALANGEVTNDEALDMEDVVKLMQYVLKAIDSLD